MKKINYKGGFSNDVFETDKFQNYINSGIVCGYIGSSERNRKRDKIVETLLRDTGLKENGIASWLTSGVARHMMDSIDKHTSESEFIENAKNYTKDAYIDVTVWSHPDQNGFLSSSIAIRENIKKYMTE